MTNTNVERLLEAGAIANAEHITDEHTRILNENFTSEEIEAMIKLKNLIHPDLPFTSDPDLYSGTML